MRDYRDAKAMAHSLREALAEKAVTLNHSECLELVAKSLGVETWNILSAKIEANGASPSNAAKPLEDVSEEKKTLYCSFCGKSQHEVKKLIAGPNVFVCDECVRMCTDIIEEPGLYGALLKDPAAAREYIQGRTSEQLAAFIRVNQKTVEWEKGVLAQFSARLAWADFAAAPPMTSGAARFNSKTRAELLALQRQFETGLTPKEAAIALVHAELAERAKS